QAVAADAQLPGELPESGRHVHARRRDGQRREVDRVAALAEERRRTILTESARGARKSMGESGKPGRDDADLKGVRRRAVEGVEVAVGETFEREQLARATHLSAKAPLE